ncbi:MAG: hypothetical protein ABIH57_00870, partial [Candidatus Omnitrophota bacterium]
LNKKEVTWDINKAAVDLTEVREKCIRRLAQSVTKSAKSLSSRAVIARYIAKSAFQNAKTKADKDKHNKA